MLLKSLLSSWVGDLVNLFYPNLCQACGNYLLQNENAICTECLTHLPKTDFHLQENNPVSVLFWGKVPIQSAASYYTFSKGSKFQKLIHKLKYQKKKEIGVELGKHFGYVLRNSDLFSGIDLIIPVPLHPKKQKVRGYNQAEMIALGLGQTMKIPVETGNLTRLKNSGSQTQKNRLERWQNVENVFKTKNPAQIAGKSILLVDDVVTTGSTLEACANALLESENVKVSVATLAYA